MDQPPSSPPSPAQFFATVNAYQQSAALKSGIELGLFTAIGSGRATAAELAESCGASERGVRILADFLTTMGFLEKEDARYRLTGDSAVFLDGKSPAYLGGTLAFLHSRPITAPFDDLTAAVRKGGTTASELGTLEPDHPVWVAFARSMAPLMAGPAGALARMLGLEAGRPARVLDVSASHGIFGISATRDHPLAELFALDWAPVLEVARENAEAAGMGKRFFTIEGSAFEADLGSGYDIVLVPNFLHHFNRGDCVRFLERVRGALKPGGRVVVVEFVPNPDRVTPRGVAEFAVIMLATTPEGDAYTFDEYAAMLAEAGFEDAALHPLPPSMHSAVVARRG